MIDWPIDQWIDVCRKYVQTSDGCGLEGEEARWLPGDVAEASSRAGYAVKAVCSGAGLLGQSAEFPERTYAALRFVAGLPSLVAASDSKAPYSFLVRGPIGFESAGSVEKIVSGLLGVIRSSLASLSSAVGCAEQGPPPPQQQQWSELVLLSVRALSVVIGGGNAGRCSRELVQEALELLQTTAKWSLLSTDFHAQPSLATGVFITSLEGVGNVAFNLTAKHGALLAAVVPFLAQQVRLARSLCASPTSSRCHVLQRLLCTLRVLAIVLLGVRNEPSLLAPLLDDVLRLVYFGADHQPSAHRPSDVSSDDDTCFASSSSSSSSVESESDRDWSAGQLLLRTTPAPVERAPPSHKIRLAALHCLAAVVKVEHKLFFSFWETFFAADSSTATDIFDVADADSSIAVRLAAISLLSAIMERSAPLLIAANDLVSPPPSFEPFSWRLATLLRTMHLRLCRSLKRQRNPTVKLALFKFAGNLLANVPYANLRPGLLDALFDVVYSFVIDQRDLRLFLSQQSIQSLQSQSQSLQSQSQSLQSQSSQSQSIQTSSCDIVSAPTLQLRRAALGCLAGFGSTLTAVASVRDLLSSRLAALLRAGHLQRLGLAADCCALLAAWSRHYADAIEAAWRSDVCAFVKSCLAPSAEEEVRGAAARLLDELSRHVQQATQLWLDLLHDVQPGLLLDDGSAAVRAAVCSLFANVPAGLPLPQRELTAHLTAIFALVQDPAPAVRAAACRTLGFFVQRRDSPLFRSHAFLSDVSALLADAVHDESVAVRLRASWSFANLCEAIASRDDTSAHGDDSDDSDDEGSWSAPDSIASTIMQLFTDTDKIRCNAVRAAGFFLRSASAAAPSVDAVLEQLLLCLCKGSVKVRWNACYAFVAVFANADLCATLDRHRVVAQLVAAVAKSANYKVRINGLQAINDCPRRLIDPAAAARFAQQLRSLAAASSQATESPVALRYQAKFLHALDQTLTFLDDLCQADT